ncbi:hypothetical protein [Candidatus Kuenenia sp.]|uniref:hypothetical protein n=1 Tax=Candidatus Kuenenia sp. TaxID=2499824 RepID=UPI00321F6D90
MPFFAGCASPFDNLSAGFTQTTFNQLLKILKKNKNKLSIYPSDRKTQELFENQFAKSKSILEPLKARIKVTDELIDEIVYKLYGLTEEEIKIVEGKHDAKIGMVSIIIIQCKIPL